MVVMDETSAGRVCGCGQGTLFILMGSMDIGVLDPYLGKDLWTTAVSEHSKDHHLHQRGASIVKYLTFQRLV